MGRERDRGQAGEGLAADELARRGYAILERNVVLGGGEIDLVAEEGGELVFVEVKTRSGPSHGEPTEAITVRKVRSLARAVRAYLASRGLHDKPVRIDVAAVSDPTETAGIIIYRDCVDLEGALRGGRWRR